CRASNASKSATIGWTGGASNATTTSTANAYPHRDTIRSATASGCAAPTGRARRRTAAVCAAPLLGAEAYRPAAHEVGIRSGRNIGYELAQQARHHHPGVRSRALWYLRTRPARSSRQGVPLLHNLSGALGRRDILRETGALPRSWSHSDRRRMGTSFLHHIRIESRAGNACQYFRNH